MKIDDVHRKTEAAPSSSGISFYMPHDKIELINKFSFMYRIDNKGLSTKLNVQQNYCLRFSGCLDPLKSYSVPSWNLFKID